jgi:hypothetical protein
MNSSYFAKLNPEQRRAAEYGRPSCNEAGPLLIKGADKQGIDLLARHSCEAFKLSKISICVR